MSAWIRTQSAAVASWRATDLATHPTLHCHPYCSDLQLELVRETHHLQIKKKWESKYPDHWLLRTMFLISSMNAILIVLNYYPSP